MRRWPWLRSRRLWAFLAGWLPTLSLPRPSLWWLAYIALIPLLLLIRSAPTTREAALRGWLWGGGFVLGMYYWLLPNLTVFLVAIAAMLGVLWLAWAVLAWWVLREPWTGPRLALAVTALPAAVVLVEWATSWDKLGGPWALLGASQWNVPPVRALAALGGPWLIGAFIVLMNVVILLAAIGGSRWRWYPIGAGALAVAVMGGWAIAIPEPTGTGTLRVALVQPGVVHDPTTRFDAGDALTRSLVAAGPVEPPLDLVVWGESSVGFDLNTRPDLMARLIELSRLTGAPLLVNVDARRPGAGGIYKTSILLDQTGEFAHYDKRRLVPFGEYIPMRRLFGWIGRLTEAAAEDRRRGHTAVLMPIELAGGRRIEIGPLISFESAFPDLSRDLVRRGADVLVFQIATSTFQDSWGPWRNAATSALRAAETGRPVMHSTLTGVTTAYDATGRRLGTVMGTDQRGVEIINVPLALRHTPYVRYGGWLPAAAAGYLLGLAAAVALRRTRQDRALSRASRTPGPP
ncbi:MAG TPA: apolipoprotein N-acyltransferase [Actinomycetes bacterium]|nr:apolipoprotein N-acyltransferase [Actinomycetes bacterium]